jgi:hypothetical protein
MSGDLAVIGATGAETGAAYVFHRGVDGAWSEIARLSAPGGGHAISLDGSIAVVGAPFHDLNGVEDSGAAYVYAVGPDADANGTMDICECLAAGDFDLSGAIGLQDLLFLLSAFGSDAAGDLDDDGDTDLDDLTELLSNYGETCP